MEYVKKQFNITEEAILNNEYDAFDLIDPVWWSVSIYDGLEQYESDLTAFTKEQRLVFAVIWYDSEVNNGGHDQFFFNSTGIVWKDALEGLKAISANERAKNFQEVIDKWDGDIPFDRAERQEKLDKLTFIPETDDYIDLFGNNDSAYYRSDENLDELIMKYAKANVKAFVFNGEVDVPKGE